MSRFFKLLGCVLAMGAVLLSSCKKDEKEDFTVTVTSSDLNKGIVSGGGVYAEGSQAVLKAIPETGFHFTKWDDNNTENPRIVTVNKNLSFTAIFAAGEGGNGGNGGDVTNITDAISLSGTMNENKTLKDLGLPIDYIIDGSLYIDGNACLTIEPGVTIAFTGESGYVEVGENAGLKMVGTAEKPIVFQGPVNNVNKGSWGYIQYKSNRSDNQMEYVIMKNGGSNEYAVLTTYLEGSVSVKNCTIDGGLGNGFETIYNNGKNLKAFENNTIKNVNGYPISIGTLVANSLGSGNKFETNGNNFIQLTGHLSDKEELTLNKQEIPYLIDGIQLNGRCEMTVNAGVTIAFEKNSEMVVYEEAIIKLEGTESEPVVLRGRESKAGYWEGVNYGSKDDESIFKNVVISDGNEYCLRLDWYNEEVLKAENLTLKNAKEYGVIVSTGTNEEEVDGEWVYSRDWSKAFEGGVTGLKFENCAKGNILDNNVLDGETDGVDNVFVAIP